MTTVVGSMPKRQWLYKRAKRTEGEQYRYGREGAWTLDGEALSRAKDDAARVAIRVQERAGIDIISDGEQRREHYLIDLIRATDGFDYRNMVEKTLRGGRSRALVGQCVGPIEYKGPVTIDDLTFLKHEADRPVKITLPGPMTVVDSTYNDFYDDDRDMAFAWADAINREARLLDELEPAVIQFDEPTFSRYPDKVLDWGIEALNRCAAGLKSETAVHVCYGYPRADSSRRPIIDSYPVIIEALEKSDIDILALEFEGANLDPSLLKACPSKKVMFGCVFNSDAVMETPQHVAGRLLKAAEFLPADQILAAPDCGLAPMSYDTAVEKLGIMVEGARLARRQAG